MNTPKFKKGDWIKRKKDGHLAQVVMLLKTCYDLRLADGEGWWLDYDYQDNWELTDAPPKNKLEEAAEKYTQEMLESWKFDSTGCRPPRESFIAGAKWQAEQDKETIELAEDHAYLAGAFNERKNMMEEAVEGEITKDNRGNNVIRAGVFNNGFEIGDKVKLIILKEED